VESGYKCWIDTMIEPGEYWRQQLANSLEDSKIILFLATPDSIASRYCQEEILYAKDLGKTIQPTSLGSQAELFEVLPRRQWKLKPAAGGAGRCTPLQSLFLKLQVQLHALDPAPRCASLPFWLVWNGSSRPCASTWGGGVPAPAVDES